MSSGWSWYVIVLVIGNIIGMAWLLLATSRPNDIDDSDTTGHKWDGIEELNNPLPKWWLWLFILSIVFAVAYLYLYPGLGNYKGSLGWSQIGQYNTEKVKNTDRQSLYFAEFADQSIIQLSNNNKAMETAGRLFANNCAVCHGSAAQGAKGFPNLTDDDWLYGDSAEAIQHSILNGRNGMMPNLGLSDAKISVLTHYVLGLSGEDVTDYSREKGKSLFMVCAGCHGLEGLGNQALGAPNLTDSTWLHGNAYADIESVLRDGKQSKMPSFKSLLSADEIRLLSAYVLSLNQ